MREIKKSGIIPEWGQIAGMRELKAILERDLIGPFRENEIYAKYNLRIPKGFLLYGPPGCGKHLLPVDLNHLMLAVKENPAELKERELQKYLK